jgi:uncharacterized membrane protein
MSLYLAAFLIGIVAGLRAMTPLAAVSWAARLNWLHLDNTWLSFMGSAAAPYIFSLLALGEIINDKLPTTPSRKVPAAFGARIFSGAFCGAAIGASVGATAVGAIIGAIGAVAGTLGGYEFRSRLVRAIGGKDLPIALLEDIIAVCLAYCIVSRV